MTHRRFTLALATVSLALGIAAAPAAFHAGSGLTNMNAVAKEAESGGRHSQPGDDKGGGRGNGGRTNGGRTGDDHPGSHSQNGKRK